MTGKEYPSLLCLVGRYSAEYTSWYRARLACDFLPDEVAPPPVNPPARSLLGVVFGGDREVAFI